MDHPGLARPYLPEVLCTLPDPRRDGSQVPGSLGVAEPRPGACVERLVSRADCRGDIGTLSLSDGQEGLLGGAVDDRER